MQNRLFAAIAATIGLFAAGAPAHADTVWVTADGTGSCTLASPCGDFNTAIMAAGNGGEVHCLTPGTFATEGLGITQPVTIDCPGGVVTSGGEGAAIVISATGTVNLRGIAVLGRPDVETGINANSGMTTLDHVTVSGFVMTGLFVQNASVTVISSVFRDNGAGVFVAPTAGIARVSLSHVTIENNTQGLGIEGTGEGECLVNLTDSVVTGNSTQGVAVATDSSARQFLTIQRSSIIMNDQDGVDAQGTQAFLLIGESTIAWNGQSGIEVSPTSQVFSYRNNQVNGNATLGTGSDITGTMSSVGLQ